MELEAERLFEYWEEEENRKKRARASEGHGDSKPSASSSGPTGPEETVPRSRGGVPMATDSGDSVQESVERKAGDSEQGVGEKLKDKRTRQGKKKRGERRGALMTGRSWPKG